MDESSPRYRVIKSLGKGGMGEVFLAEDTLLERQVALKFLPDDLQHDARARERFQREARSAAALDHPFICKIHEITTLDGKTCIVMEYVEGETLLARMARARLAPERVAPDCGGDRGRSVRSPPAAHRPSRPQAVKRHAHRAGARQGDGLRPRQTASLGTDAQRG